MSYTPGPLPEPDEHWMTDAHRYTAEQLSTHTAAEVARAVAAERERWTAEMKEYGASVARIAEAVERERCAVVAWSHFMVRCNHLKTNPATQDGWCAADAIRADPQRLPGKGE